MWSSLSSDEVKPVMFSVKCLRVNYAASGSELELVRCSCNSCFIV